MPKNSRDWLDELLSGVVPTDNDLKQLVADCAEDQHLEYKAGKLLQASHAADELRECVAAFGNSDGGVVLVGYDQNAHAFDDASAPGGSKVDEWATRVLSSLAPSFSPPPRIMTAQADGKTVLIVATCRAPRLVPVPLKRDLVYYIRIGESNSKAPAFLVSDLVLGRRNHPVLVPRLSDCQLHDVRDIGCPNVQGVDLGLSLVLENRSFVFAEDVRCGLITWTCSDKPSPKEGAVVPDTLQSNIDITCPPHYKPQTNQPEWQLVQVRLARHMAAGIESAGRPLHIGALEETLSEPMKWFTLPLFPNNLSGVPAAEKKIPTPLVEDVYTTRMQLRGAVELKAALYVLSRNAEPWWSQLTMRYDMQIPAGALKEAIKLESLSTPRPMVSLAFYAPEGARI